ncbi:hypothetical protein [Azospirillum picis]|uniref:Uncharacterized protein n=1 Tax=Azospirillum picis TaxID=488438 RepID=A0ABU0MNQ2_9PROT|nr:hypothetical protein [Azospirillum picis]MBP2301277.1 hypothetical protein [Azospirillum picis]MDQ0535108.1 hypothetical protein [Azospirillum picis]
MTHISPAAVASSLDALAGQLSHLAKNPSQQAPAQAATLADRFDDLARMLRLVDFRGGVRLAQHAEKVRGRAVARPFMAYNSSELAELVATLQTAAALAREAARRPHGAVTGGGDAA